MKRIIFYPHGTGIRNKKIALLGDYLPRKCGIKPNENEREGYAPTVGYSCGSLLRGRQLIISYAMSGYATTFATLSLDDVLAAMD